MEEILKYLSVYLVSSVKFLGGPLAGIALGLAYYETVLLTIAGMMSSVIVFSYIGRAASTWYSAHRRKKNKPIFGRRSRAIVKVWQRLGIIGVAFFTPLFLTPVFGTMVAAVFGVRKRSIFLHMLWSAVLWGCILTYMVYRFGDFTSKLF